jgi:hypothetical protein
MKYPPTHSYEEHRLLKNSRAYHAHPSHPSDCEAYTEFYNTRRCPCEGYQPAKKENDK